MTEKIALVTGANRGIGLGIVQGLHDEGFTTILTSRNEGKGRKAVDELKKEGYDVIFHKLDVCNHEEIREITEWIENTYGKLDVLVNNAGIMQDRERTMNDAVFPLIRKTFETNFFGPVAICMSMIPLLEKSEDPRIINISSGLGVLNREGGPRGYPAYCMSKTALNGLTAQMAADCPEIKTFSMCPGWVKTAMGGDGAEREVEKGAETAIWLATSDKPQTGKFYRDMKEIEW